MGKPILCLDFDGVIHSYKSGWQGAGVVADAPVPGAMEFIREAMHHFRVAIFSSRSNQPGGITAMQNWLFQHYNYAGFREIEWPLEKPAAFLTIDDRAITFDGKWPEPATLLEFKPWNKK